MLDHTGNFIRGIDCYPDGVRIEFFEEGRMVAWLVLDASIVALGQQAVDGWNEAIAAVYGRMIEVWQIAGSPEVDWLAQPVGRGH